MEVVDKAPDEKAAQVWYQVDICQLTDSSKAITHSFEALVVLLAGQLLVSRMEIMEGAGLEGEEEGEPEDVEDEHV